MLKPALLYAQEITRKFTEHLYTTDYYYYCGYYCVSSLPKIEEEEDLYQYAIVDSTDNVIGFLRYRVNDYNDTVQDFGLFSFDKGNPILGIDVFHKLEQLIKNHHRVEWRVVGNNPVKRHYDKYCKIVAIKITEDETIYRANPAAGACVTFTHDEIGKAAFWSEE